MIKLVLLDRDGVLNEEREDYIKSPEELVLIPGAAEAVAELNKAGIKVAVITNQSVVGRGLITEEKLHEIHEKLKRDIAKAGGSIDKIFFCADAPSNATVRRKPNPGMLLEAMESFGINATEAIMIGDAVTDFQAAKAAGCKFILVQTGKGEKIVSEKKLDFSVLNIYRSISDATKQILGGKFD